MNIIRGTLPGLVIVEPDVFRDERGWLLEAWHARRYADAGLPDRFAQSNLSRSRGGVLRGLHYQWAQMQGKLVSAVYGEVFDVAVDIRRGSPTFGRWEAHLLSADNARQAWLPPGFAHGFVVLSEEAVVWYQCTDHYRGDAQGTVLWSDPDLAIRWPVTAPTMSPRDAAGTRLRDIPVERLPRFEG